MTETFSTKVLQLRKWKTLWHKQYNMYHHLRIEGYCSLVVPGHSKPFSPKRKKNCNGHLKLNHDTLPDYEMQCHMTWCWRHKDFLRWRGGGQRGKWDGREEGCFLGPIKLREGSSKQGRLLFDSTKFPSLFVRVEGKHGTHYFKLVPKPFWQEEHENFDGSVTSVDLSRPSYTILLSDELVCNQFFLIFSGIGCRWQDNHSIQAETRRNCHYNSNNR